MRMKTYAFCSLGAFVALALAAGGCELIAAVDHDLIPQGGGLVGGAGGTGGAASSSTTSTGGGGMGGSGGMPSCIADECPDPGSDCLMKACDGDMCDATPPPVAELTPCNSAPGEGGGGGGTMAGVCDGDGACVECVGNDQCTAPEVCDTTANECVPMQCQDGMMNGMETGEDCGGPDCGDCPNGQGCMGAGDCLSGFCNVNVCAACTDNSQCDTAAEFCDEGVCVPKQANGVMCASGAECVSGNCPITGGAQVCCDTACGSPCQSCVMMFTGVANGTCGNVMDNSDPKNACPSAGPSCMGSSLNPLDTCVAGTCSGTAMPCPDNYACQSVTACFTTCGDHPNCAPGNYCGGAGGALGMTGDCLAKKAAGQMCAIDVECISNDCGVGGGGAGGGPPTGTCN